MNDDVIVKVIAKITIPVILIFGFYVFMHGTVAPGGAFQAGAIFGSGAIIYCLTHGSDKFIKVISMALLEKIIVSGVAIYAFIGVIAMVMGGKFLEYKALATNPYTGQSIGIMGIEFGVSITVFAVITYIYLVFVRLK